jgi:membrane protein DedA with SNARE-associated domain
MSFLNFGDVGHWVIGNGYTLLFVGMIIEGPVLTAAAAFAAALGYLNIWLVLVFSVLGNFIPDLIFYSIGYWGRKQFADKYGHYFGLSSEKLEKAERFIEKHSGKSLITIKLVPFLATPGLIVAGISRMPIKRFAMWSIIITVPSSLFYLVLGYYFGAAYVDVIHYIRIGGYIIGAAVIALALILYFERKFTKRLSKSFENED